MKYSSLDELQYMFLRSQNRKRYWRIFTVRTIGNIFILSSLVFLFIQFYPVIAAEVKFKFDSVNGRNAYLSTTTASTESTKSGELQKTLPALSEDPKDKDFGIVIPKIEANSTIIPNVDPFNKTQYLDALNKGVAHAKGTKYPGETGNVYLFAHNTLNAWDVPKYNAVFYLLNNLDPGDRITTFYKQKRYDYIVFDKQVYNANDLSPLEAQYDEPILSLQTCWPPGTTWKRLVIRAKLDK